MNRAHHHVKNVHTERFQERQYLVDCSTAQQNWMSDYMDSDLEVEEIGLLTEKKRDDGIDAVMRTERVDLRGGLVRSSDGEVERRRNRGFDKYRDTRRLWWVLLPDKMRSNGGDFVGTERRQRRRRKDRDSLRPWWILILLLAVKTREDGGSKQEKTFDRWWVSILLLPEMTRPDGGDAVWIAIAVVLAGGFRSVVFFRSVVVSIGDGEDENHDGGSVRRFALSSLTERTK
ncbi:hypothetical protein DY000_02013147 [Brassica cretica]|uniref:Uncharacterized protein n=1 Tax=Brassica cretica TaxID=69181 RepID=A0ABQ7CTX7_BRACR|nr:hypothetical protein DY000_02013147 [Brassica cretica]